MIGALLSRVLSRVRPGRSTMAGALRAAARRHPVEAAIDVGASDGRWAALARRSFPAARALLIEAQPSRGPTPRSSSVARSEGARPQGTVDGSPLVTVVTPSFQYARYLSACLDSVRRQTYPHIEHLVLDACSTDGSAEVIAPFQGTYPLRAWFEPDLGQADALNKGFARAQGQVFCWLNADDLWLHERVVEEAVEAIRGGAEVVSGGGWVIDAEGRRVKPVRAHPRRAIRELRAYDSLLQPATFWRAAVHRPLRTDLHYVFDWQLFLELRAAGARFEIRDTAWAGYRMHTVNKTAADPARRRHEVAALLRDQFGPRSFPHLWAAALASGYDVAERRRWPALKRALQLANTAVFFLSGRRVVSC